MYLLNVENLRIGQLLIALPDFALSKCVKDAISVDGWIKSFPVKPGESWKCQRSSKFHRITNFCRIFCSWFCNILRSISRFGNLIISKIMLIRSSEIFQNLEPHIRRDHCSNLCSIHKMSVARFWIITLQMLCSPHSVKAGWFYK